MEQVRIQCQKVAEQHLWPILMFDLAITRGKHVYDHMLLILFYSFVIKHGESFILAVCTIGGGYVGHTCCVKLDYERAEVVCI